MEDKVTNKWIEKLVELGTTLTEFDMEVRANINSAGKTISKKYILDLEKLRRQLAVAIRRVDNSIGVLN